MSTAVKLHVELIPEQVYSNILSMFCLKILAVLLVSRTMYSKSSDKKKKVIPVSGMDWFSFFLEVISAWLDGGICGRCHSNLIQFKGK